MQRYKIIKKWENPLENINWQHSLIYSKKIIASGRKYSVSILKSIVLRNAIRVKPIVKKTSDTKLKNGKVILFISLKTDVLLHQFSAEKNIFLMKYRDITAMVMVIVISVPNNSNRIIEFTADKIISKKICSTLPLGWSASSSNLLLLNRDFANDVINDLVPHIILEL